MRDLLVGAVFAGYKIEGLAGRGGMGVVYRARHLRLDRVDALKLIAPEFADDPVFRARFERESRVAARIEHPNVITIYDADEDDGQLYLAMRYVEGTDLRAELHRCGRFEPDRAVMVLSHIASALDAAHRIGLVHRDVKPANILLMARDGVDHVFLSDFGLTKHLESRGGETGTGRFVGTTDYIAPEQVLGEPLDARADIYSLGCVLFHLLAGRVPYPRQHDMAAAMAHVHDPPPSLLELRPELAEHFDPVIAKAMAKDPTARYGTAGELAAGLAAAASQHAGAIAVEATVVDVSRPTSEKIDVDRPSRGSALRERVEAERARREAGAGRIAEPHAVVVELSDQTDPELTHALTDPTSATQPLAQVITERPETKVPAHGGTVVPIERVARQVEPPDRSAQLEPADGRTAHEGLADELLTTPLRQRRRIPVLIGLIAGVAVVCAAVATFVLSRGGSGSSLAGRSASSGPPGRSGAAGGVSGTSFAAGKAVFTGSAGCGACHTLAAAGTTGTVGPNLGVTLVRDAKARGLPLKLFIEESITKPNAFSSPGFAPNIMPQNYNQTLTSAEIRTLVNFIVSVTSGIVTLDLRPTGAVYVCVVDGSGKKLIPGLVFDAGQTIPVESASRLLVALGNASVQMKVNGRPVMVKPTATSIGFDLTPTGVRELAVGQQPRCL